jgi:hypothetical protein
MDEEGKFSKEKKGGGGGDECGRWKGAAAAREFSDPLIKYHTQ